jgi:hypothetical protein
MKVAKEENQFFALVSAHAPDELQWSILSEV